MDLHAIPAVVAGHADDLWYGTRFSAADVRAFQVDQETGGGDYLTVETVPGKAWHVVGTRRPVVVGPDEGWRRAAVVALALRAWLAAPDVEVKLSEEWSAAVRRAGAG